MPCRRAAPLWLQIYSVLVGQEGHGMGASVPFILPRKFWEVSLSLVAKLGPSHQLVYPGELHYSSIPLSLLHFSPAHSPFIPTPPHARAHAHTRTHGDTHKIQSRHTHTMFF